MRKNVSAVKLFLFKTVKTVQHLDKEKQTNNVSKSSS